MNFPSKRPNQAAGQGRILTNLLALDFATTGVKAVRLRKIKEQITLAAADILAPCAPDAVGRPDLPRHLSAYYAALCATMDEVSLRVLTQAIPEDENIEGPVREALGAPASSRVSGTVVFRGKREGTILGAAVPEKIVQHYLELFADGAPAPRSLEISGLAAFSAFLFNYGGQTENQTICLIETGARCTYAAFLHRNQFQIVNRFDVGGDTLQRQVQSALGVDADTARDILSAGSADVSDTVRKALSPFTRQLAIYREFAERRNKSSLSAVYISGGQATSHSWQTAIKEVLGFVPQVWNPFEKIEILPEAYPARLKGQEPRFAAAVGTALAGIGCLMDLPVNLLKKTEWRYQGMVSMKVMALGSISVLISVSIMVFLLAGISKMSLNADLERARLEWAGLGQQEPMVRSALAASASNNKTLAALESRKGNCPPMYSVLRSVQENVPSLMALNHFSAGIGQINEKNPLCCTLRISGTAQGELTAVEAKQQLNADARLHSFCGEIRLVASRRYFEESWAFALEGSRPLESAQ
jgi:hypothetical protein